MILENLTRTKLDNGLTVLVRESHVAPVASFWIYYRVGSRNELPGSTGISHWVEHMLFKGTPRVPNGEFDRAISRAGGMSNGMTSQDWTTYFETLPSERIDLALDFESDRMVNVLFDDDEVESERTVILSEREGAENNSFWLLNEEVQAAAFRVHSYHHPTIGWRSDLLQLSRIDLERHYRTYYTPNNAVAVLVGDVNTPAMLDKLNAVFGSLPPGPAVPPVRLVEPPQQAERRILLRSQDQTPYLLYAFPGVAASDADFFPLIVLDAVLSGAKGMGVFGGGGSNRSSRLYRALVERDLAVGAASSFRPALDPDLFSFYITLAPGVTHQAAEDALWAELAAIQRDGVREAELHKAIKQTKAQFAYSSESVTHQGYWLGFSEVVTGLEWLDGWLERLAAVTVADVQRVAQTYFTPARMTAGWTLPEAQS